MDINNILHGQENIQLIIWRDDLIEFANSYASRLIEKIPKGTSIEESERPLSQPEAIKFLGKSRQTLIKWRKKGFIKGHTLGGRVYYFKSELIAALNRVG